VERSGCHHRRALLKSADASLADMNDPSLITARRAITDDVASLSAISQVDYDGIILKVNQLSNQIDNLRLADNDDDAPMDSDSSSGCRVPLANGA
jgi:uroporphyrin-3 C-methyltransferase